MIHKHPSRAICLLLFCCVMLGSTHPAMTADAGADITPPNSGPAPHINGPSIFGVRPGSPFFYQIPATGERPMEFSAKNLPEGLRLDAHTGLITGSPGGSCQNAKK